LALDFKVLFFDASVKTAAVAGMTRGSADLVHPHQNGVLVAVDMNGFNQLQVAGRLALDPQFLAAATEKVASPVSRVALNASAFM
jgi:hypothetical protein